MDDHFNVLAHRSMEGITSLLDFETADDLKHRLLCTTLELESARMEAMEKTRRNEEHETQLLGLLKLAVSERDEAREQLQILLNKFTKSNSPEPFLLQPINQQAESSFTESDDLSMESLFEPVSSENIQNINNKSSESNNLVGMQQTSEDVIDRASIIINNLAMSKPLPEKGKLLQAVMEAGPLLHTLLLAGPLPQWRTPPPLQPILIPRIHSNLTFERNLLHDDIYPINSASIRNFQVSGSSCLRKSKQFSWEESLDVKRQRL